MEAQIYSKSNPFDNLRVSFEELVPDTYPNKKEGAEWTTEPYNWTSMLFYRCRMLCIEEKEKKDEDEKKETKEAKKKFERQLTIYFSCFVGSGWSFSSLRFLLIFSIRIEYEVGSNIPS